MNWTYSDDYYKQYTRETWDEAAVEYDRLIAAQYEPFGHALLTALQVTPDDDVLDIATGPGEPALTIGAMLARPGARGSVTGIDLSPRMVELASRRAVERGLERVRFEVQDAERMNFPNGSFDVVLSRFGFQIITDPEGAAAEIVRVLRPGGRVGLAVWTGADENPGLHVVVGPMLEHAEPDENGYLPTPYEMGGPGELATLLEGAGCRGLAERRVPGHLRAASVDAYWETVMRGTPLGHSLREEDAAVQADVEAQSRANIAAYAAPDGSVAIPVTCLIVTGTR